MDRTMILDMFAEFVSDVRLETGYAEAFRHVCDHGLSCGAKDRPTHLPATIEQWTKANARTSEATVRLGLAIGNAQRDLSSPDQAQREILKALAAGGDPNDLPLHYWRTIHRPCGLMFTMIDSGLRFTPYQAEALYRMWVEDSSLPQYLGLWRTPIPSLLGALSELAARKQSSTLLAAIHEQATKLAAPKRKI